MSGPALVWLRDDLRFDDQPAIAAVAYRPSLFVYVHDESSPGLHPLGGANRWSLDKSLAAFRQQIAARAEGSIFCAGPRRRSNPSSRAPRARVLQGARYDPEGGAYVRRWIPELARLESTHIHAPWLAPSDALAQAAVAIGRTYPAPIVDHALARRRALDGLAAIKA
jgi:deoxyribodipyrimidine photolyase